MTASFIKSLLSPLRVAAARFAHDPQQRHTMYTGNHGCLRVAASHIAWNNLDGDYLEFGVFRGDSVIEAYHAIEWNRASAQSSNSQLHGNPAYDAWCSNPPRLIAFDSFEGLPSSSTAGHSDYFEGSYACSEAQFLLNVTTAGVPVDRVTTVKGMYDTSLTPEIRSQLRLEKAAIVMVDCDLYESTVPVLEFIGPLLRQGSIVIFHDWYRYGGDRQHGEQRACGEWLERNPQLELEPYWQEGPQAKAFLVHLRSPDLPK